VQEAIFMPSSHPVQIQTIAIMYHWHIHEARAKNTGCRKYRQPATVKKNCLEKLV
jgi:hypothetical protein